METSSKTSRDQITYMHYVLKVDKLCYRKRREEGEEGGGRRTEGGERRVGGGDTKMRIDVNDTVDDNLQLQEERDRNRKCVMQYKGERGKRKEREGREREERERRKKKEKKLRRSET